ncbi:MAG TPA: DUF4397 domain-containing protein [Dehalococcoidia bacterium]
MRVLLTALLAVAAVAATAVGAAGQAGTGTVTVVHGVPGLPVDVYVNDQRTLTNFQPGTITDPLQLPAGTYRIAVRPAGADPASPPAISGSAVLNAGDNVSIVAHLTEGGDPTLTVFANNVSALPAGQARVTVRHTAAAAAVDVLVNGQPAIRGLTNPNEATATLAAGTYQVAVAPAGTTSPVIGPLSLTFQDGTAYFVYAIGGADKGGFTALVQTVRVAGPRPGVPAGTGGLLDGGGFPDWGVWLMLAAAGGVLVSGATLARRRG